MGRIEYQRGELTLPSAAVADVRKALRDATNALHEQAKIAAHDFWENHAKRTRSARLYNARLDTYIHADKRAFTGSYFTATTHISGLAYPLTETLFDMLQAAAAKPHKLTVTEIDAHFPRATKRTADFRVGEGAISINVRKLSWSTGHNKTVVEHFAEHPVGQALFAALGKVAWTRGTGGHAWGSDEYAEYAAREHGYNPVSTQGAWGPLGEAQRAVDIGISVAQYRKMTGRPGRR